MQNKPLSVNLTLGSMTAFAKQTTTTEAHSINCEIRALNHRHLDIHCYLADGLGYLEPLLRTRIKANIRRGRIEVRLHYQTTEPITAPLSINEARLSQLLSCHARISEYIAAYTPPDALQLLAWPGVLQTPTVTLSDDNLTAMLLAHFDNTLAELLIMRQTEGQIIKQSLLERLDKLEIYLQTVRTQLPIIRENQKQKLLTHFSEATLNVNPQRFEQEFVILLQKMDSAEELDRLSFHAAECRKQLQNKATTGRHLDFLMQELQREANTLAAKSVDATLSLQLVDIKVLIEEMREQIQNIE